MSYVRRCGSHLVRWMAAITITLWLPASTGRGGDDAAIPSPEQGNVLAQKLCAACHLTGNTTGATVPAGVPTFHGIANTPGQTGQRIMNILIKPHPPMPDIQLTREEMLHIIAYLDSLRTDKSGPPLMELDQPKSKPEYPDHS
jgi:cytochrome c